MDSEANNVENIKNETSTIKEVYIGTTKIIKIYIGTTLVYGQDDGYMSMIKKVTVTISKDNKKVKLSSPLYFYKYDSLTIEFEIEKYNFELKSYQRINLLKAVGFVETANGKDSVETTILQGQTIMIKLLPEHTKFVGESKIQFVIVDGDGCQSATPPIPYRVEELINDVIVKIDNEGNIVIEENNDMPVENY